MKHVRRPSSMSSVMSLMTVNELVLEMILNHLILTRVGTDRLDVQSDAEI